MTLRRLWRMARERKKFEGEVVSYLIAWIVRAMPMVNLKVDPDKINPWREQKPKSAEEVALEEWKTKRRFQLICGSKKQ